MWDFQAVRRKEGEAKIYFFHAQRGRGNDAALMFKKKKKKGGC